MSRRRSEIADAPGQDSFLDIVANLVGILIILVMVIGVRCQDALLEAAPVLTNDEPAVTAEIAAAGASIAAVESDIHQLSSKIARHDVEVAYRRKERDKKQFMLAAIEEALAANRGELGVDQQRQLDLQSELLAARQQLQELHQSIQVAEGSASQVAVIEHLPTPMAKTVFGNEIHFRLLGGRLAFVPWNEFADKLKKDAPQKVWRLKETNSIAETIGPLGGFLMKYELKRTQQATATRVGMAVQQRVELDKFVLLPVEDDLGEPLSEALREGSQFQARLATSDPGNTTVTVWTYPDSFNEYRELKQELFRRGFLTASRPLPSGIPIGGSPRGTRSAAQ